MFPWTSRNAMLKAYSNTLIAATVTKVDLRIYHIRQADIHQLNASDRAPRCRPFSIPLIPVIEFHGCEPAPTRAA
jgi:hypothetical protein